MSQRRFTTAFTLLALMTLRYKSIGLDDVIYAAIIRCT